MPDQAGDSHGQAEGDDERAQHFHAEAQLCAVKAELTRNGIDLPYPTQQILFHDQTEEADGDRGRQREGWPAPSRSGGVASERKD